MPTILNVAEKPQAAKKIANILSNGNSQQARGLSKFNPIHRFPRHFQNNTANFVVCSVTGHVLEYIYPENYKSWYSCDPFDLLSAPLFKHVISSKTAVVSCLQKQVQHCDSLILWLDCDREGENIANEVKSLCTTVNPNINVFRARFSSLTPSEINGALNNLTSLNLNESAAVDARLEIDLRIGASFTRFQTLLLRGANSDIPNPLSYGPCQFPTLGFIVQKQQQIDLFQPENMWTIQLTHDIIEAGKKLSTKFNWCRGNIFDRETAVILFELCIHSIAKISSISTKKNTKFISKPFPLSSIEFQKLCSKNLRMSSHRAMEVAEKLYTKGIISYPRTETNHYSKNFDFISLIEEQLASPIWGGFAQQLCTGSFCSPRNGSSSDNAHPPIHPTKFIPMNKFSTREERNVYELIVRHFLACCSSDAFGFETTITAQLGIESFTVKGVSNIQRNYLEVFSYETWRETNLPRFVVGEHFTPTALELKTSLTSSPEPLTEEGLISLMDKHGIGTDATIPQHITTIQDRKYATKEGRFFYPTSLGVSLVSAYEGVGIQLAKPFLRARMESGMKDVCTGKYSKQVLLDRILSEMKTVFLELASKKAEFASEFVKMYSAAH